ncbi:bursicon-like [Schistocerca serialis cubense]|uniref:bursicon-like n=1 Tax=Schistocerca serialis cubense TaxID=2023355 RepID=UPI00214EB5E3|nr:bursicon-like [Schistocerca serialis cubense]
MYQRSVATCTRTLQGQPDVSQRRVVVETVQAGPPVGGRGCCSPVSEPASAGAGAAVPRWWLVVAAALLAAPQAPDRSPADECQLTPVIHVLQYPGCVPKPIPSFACTGRCSSYLQVSGSKIWQMERSCMCCQESGEREASVSLFCPKAKPGERKFRKVSTKAPLECMCRPCTGVEESAVIPQEMAGYPDDGPLAAHFRKSQ